MLKLDWLKVIGLKLHRIFKKIPDPVIFWHNFIKITLISVIPGILGI